MEVALLESNFPLPPLEESRKSCLPELLCSSGTLHIGWSFNQIDTDM